MEYYFVLGQLKETYTRKQPSRRFYEGSVIETISPSRDHGRKIADFDPVPSKVRLMPILILIAAIASAVYLVLYPNVCSKISALRESNIEGR